MKPVNREKVPGLKLPFAQGRTAAHIPGNGSGYICHETWDILFSFWYQTEPVYGPVAEDLFCGSDAGRYSFSSPVTNSPVMKATHYPVILVHGWNSHPGIWKKLVVHLQSAGIPYGNFDHSGMRDSTLPEISAALLEYLGTVRNENSWSGPVDIVSHSMGTCIVRYLLEVTTGKNKVRRSGS